jgi:hypothetical protein
MSERLDGVPAGLGVVVRALPAAAAAASEELDGDVAQALGTCLRRLGHRPNPLSVVSQ